MSRLVDCGCHVVLRLACTATSHADGEKEDVEEQLDDGYDYLGVPVHRPVLLIIHRHHHPIDGEQVWRKLVLSFSLLP